MRWLSAGLKRSLVGSVKTYRLLLSPWLGSACRFEPTCSAYALQALQAHGSAAGTYLTLRRLARCHPWCEAGFDPVPELAPRLFGRASPDSVSHINPDARWPASAGRRTKTSHD